MGIKFGPAGIGSVKEAESVLEEYHKKGIQAAEIPFTYAVFIKHKEDAVRIGKKAKELGIELSIHAQYWINLNSEEKEKREASMKRILDCCEMGHYLGVKVVVFHAGYYTNKGLNGEDKEKSYQTIKSAVEEIMKTIKQKGWDIKIAAETMGRVNVFGSIEEVSRLVKETGCGFCIDFAHILAREKEVDYEKIEKLFPQKEWHCHFSGIVYGEKGEKHHKKTEKEAWRELIKNIKHLEKSKNLRIINEAPTPFIDCVDGLKVYQGMQ